MVLEPSPPAVTADPFADDPLSPPTGEGTVVSPIAGIDGATTWDALAAERPEIAEYARTHWLGAWSPLGPLPAGWTTTRLNLHRVAAYVVSPARRQAIEKMGLRYTSGGFGTPFFVRPAEPSVSVQVRVEGLELVHQRGDTTTSTPLTTLNELASFLGIEPDVPWASELDIPGPGGLDDPLDIDADAAVTLADWYGFAYSVLEELRAEPASVEASNPQLWPEHFDPAIEIGSDAAKQRGSYGASPGDAEGGEDEPYLYVSAWYPEAIGDDSFWNSTSFPGAKLTYRELLGTPDHRQAALDFYRRGRGLLVG